MLRRALQHLNSPCTSWSKDKSHVENAVKLVYRAIFAQVESLHCPDLRSLNAAIRSALEGYNNKFFSRRQCFDEIERDELGELNHMRYSVKKSVMVKVDKYGHVLLGEDKHIYSVPHTLIGRKVRLAYSATDVEVWDNLKMVAHHSRERMEYGRTHDAFKISLESTIKEQMTQDQFLFHLVNCEWDNRNGRAVQRAIKYANFRYRACLEEVDYTLERGIDKNQVERLASMEFIRSHRDLFITGPTVTGKSYLATALGYRACSEGFKVLYASTARLISSLKIAKAKGLILGELKRIERCDLLILDDFAMQGFDAQGRSILMDISRIDTRDAPRYSPHSCQ